MIIEKASGIGWPEQQLTVTPSACANYLRYMEKQHTGKYLRKNAVKLNMSSAERSLAVGMMS